MCTTNNKFHGFLCNGGNHSLYQNDAGKERFQNPITKILKIFTFFKEHFVTRFLNFKDFFQFCLVHKMTVLTDNRLIKCRR